MRATAQSCRGGAKQPRVTVGKCVIEGLKRAGVGSRLRRKRALEPARDAPEDGDRGALHDARPGQRLGEGTNAGLWSARGMQRILLALQQVSNGLDRGARVYCAPQL